MNRIIELLQAIRSGYLTDAELAEIRELSAVLTNEHIHALRMVAGAKDNPVALKAAIEEAQDELRKEATK